MSIDKSVAHLLTQWISSQKVTGLCLDSRNVKPGDLFFAIKGSQVDGHAYIDQAIKRGAIAVVVETNREISTAVPIIEVEDVAEVFRWSCRLFYQDPLAESQWVGVTGTNGKTTVTYMLESILKAAQQTFACLGTINYRINEKIWGYGNTTPGPPLLYHIAADMKSEGVNWGLLEVSSHALDQGRVVDVPFKVAIFTHLGRDHLDYHLTQENYKEAKKTIFTVKLKELRGLKCG